MKLIILFSIAIVFVSCNQNIYNKFTFKEKGVRELNFYFINDTLGTFQVNYLCTEDVVSFKQKFTHRKISDNKISIRGIDKNSSKPFTYVPLEKLNNCTQLNEFSNMEKIPIINNEVLFVHKRKLYWQKIKNEKIVSAYLFKGKLGKLK